MVPDWWSAWWTAAAAVAALLLLWWRHHSLHFARRGLPYSTPLPLVGNMSDLMLRKKSFAEIVYGLYRLHEPHPYAGVFSFIKKAVMIRHPEAARVVTVKDFDHFTDHSNFLGSTEMNPLFEKSLFALKGNQWHDTRTTLSPAFTSMKMKNMYVFMSEVAQQMVEHLKERTAEHTASCGKADLLTLEMKEFFTRLANDVIASTAFGVRVDSLVEPDNEFYRMGQKLVTPSVLVGLGYSLSTKMMEILDVPFFDRKAEKFFRNMVSDTIRTREEQGISRKDMIDLLLQARRGQLTSEETYQDEAVDKPKVQLEEEDIAAQAMIFFLGGFDTVSTLMTFCSYVLAINQEAQHRLQKEVDELMEKCRGQPSYEQVMSCPYLDMVMSETLRLYTPVPLLDRVCVRAYRLPAVDDFPGVDVQPGDTIWLPAFGFHRDERFFPDPEHFDPERFSPDNKHLIKPFTYFPFGTGPRVCIAQRFAILEAKTMLLHLVSQFSFHAVSKTATHFQFDIKNFNLGMKDGTWLGIACR